MPYEKITFGEMKTLGMNRLGNVAFYTKDEVGTYLNEALRVWNVITCQWKNFKYVPTVAGQRYYNTSSLFLKVVRVKLNRGGILDLTSLLSLDLGQPGWQLDTGVPERWFPVGLTQIGIYPPDSTSDNMLHIEGVVPAPVMTSDDDYLDLGQWQIQALLDYVHHLATFKQGGEEFKASHYMLRNFMKAAAIQNSKFSEQALYRRYMGRDLDEMLRPNFIVREQSGNGSAAAQ